VPLTKVEPWLVVEVAADAAMQAAATATRCGSSGSAPISPPTT
jgi:hypothetical protein